MINKVLRVSLLCLLSVGMTSAQVSVSQNVKLMGSAFAFTAIHSDTLVAKSSIEAAIIEVDRIEDLISSWKQDSETTLLNNNAGVRPVKVSNELIELILRAKKISKMSNGYFDISFASINHIWKFDGEDISAPDKNLIAGSVQNINFENIVVDRKNGTVFLTQAGMRIGFGGIGKGYAADRAKQVMLDHGVESGVVNASGDLLAWGKQPNGDKWKVGIADPREESNIISWLDITDQAVVTSGNYEKFVTIAGKRYGHIIDPKTGWPVTGVVSVTVICSDAELADALATTIFVLGENDGLKLADHLSGVECVIIDDEGAIHYSKNVKTRLL